MIYKLNVEHLITNPRELAQKRLKSHQEKGNKSNLSIFEVANLMDQITFSENRENIQSKYFEICIN
jgi:hypothetical protein